MSGRDKTESCMWCGGSEARGIELRRRLLVGAHEKFECMNKPACDRRVRAQILKGA